MNRIAIVLLFSLMVGGFMGAVQAQTVGPLTIEPNGSCSTGGSGPRISVNGQEGVCLDDSLICPEETGSLPECAVAPIISCLTEGTDPTPAPVCATAQPIVQAIVSCAMSGEPTSEECADLVDPVEPILGCILEGEGEVFPPGFPVQVCANLGGTLEQVAACVESMDPSSPACAALLTPVEPILACLLNGTDPTPVPACSTLRPIVEAIAACVDSGNPTSEACADLVSPLNPIIACLTLGVELVPALPVPICGILSGTLGQVAECVESEDPSSEACGNLVQPADPILACILEGTDPTPVPACSTLRPIVEAIAACVDSGNPTSEACADLVSPLNPIIACLTLGTELLPMVPVPVCAILSSTLDRVIACVESGMPTSEECAALLSPAQPVLDCVQDGTTAVTPIAPACAAIAELGAAGAACLASEDPESPECEAFLGAPPELVLSFLCSTGVLDDAPPQLADMLCPKPTLAIVATTAAAAEPGTNGLFTITRSNAPTTDALTVTFLVTGAAERPIDYTLRKGETVLGTTVTIDAGQASVAITVEVVNDGAQEVSEAVILDITPTAGFPAGAKTATVNIADDDTPSLSVTAVPASPATVAEPSITGIFTITRNSAELDRLVTFTTAGTATRGGAAPDYVLKKGEEVLDGAVMMGVGETSVTITVEVVDDSTVEPAETIVLDISSNNAAFPAGAKTASMTIAASDAPTLVLTVAATTSAATESGTDGAFTITRSGAPTTDALDVTFAVTGTATRGTDYTLMQGTTALAASLVTIPAGASSTVVTVDVIDDPTPEVSPQVTPPTVTPGASPTNPPTVTPPGVALVQTETVLFDISATTGTTGTGQKSATVTIADNDPDVDTVLARIDDCIVYIVEGDPAIYLPAGGRCYTFLTGREPPPGCNDFIFAPNPVVCFVPPIPPQVVTTLCGNANVATQLRPLGYCIPPVRTVALDLQGGLQVHEESPLTDTFRVSLASQPTADVPVTFTAFPTGQIGTLAGLTFTSANWNIPQTVTVTAIQDRVDDGDNNVRITATANGGGYSNVQAQADVAVLDVDLVLLVTDGVTAVVEDGSIARLTIARDSASIATALEVPFKAEGAGATDVALTAVALADGSCAENDNVPVTGTGVNRGVSIPSGCRSVQLQFTTLPDSIAEPTEAIVVTVQDPGTGIDVGMPGQQSLNILDNDVLVNVAPANPVDDTASETPGPGVDGDGLPIPNVARFAITLSQPSRVGGTPIEFSLAGSATADDYTLGLSSGSFAGPTTVVVPAGATSVTLIFTPLDDSIVEGQESVILRAEPSTIYQLGATAQQTAALLDNDVVTPNTLPESAPATENATTPPPANEAAQPAPETPPAVETPVVVPPASSESSSGLGEQPVIAPLVPLADAVAANREVVTKAVRIGGINTISWQLPAEPPAPIKGVQVWRSNSPYVLLVTLPAGSSGFEEASYDDVGAPSASRYLVTMYYGPSASDGLLDNSNAPQTGTYAGTATVVSGAPSPFALLFGIALALAAVGTLGYAVVLRIRKEA
ncbi:MAG: Calx-beta domain-containing protein [Candidatus Thermoplasmatota archaeon]